MNKSDSERLGWKLEDLGYEQVQSAEKADMIILNSCVVRQSAEDKVVNKLSNLKALKRDHPEKTLVLAGCMVGPRIEELRDRFPYVDLFLRPQQFDALLEYIGASTSHISILLPHSPSPTTYIPIIRGCNNFCSFCIVPYRRGRENSRPVSEIVTEAEKLAEQGVKEVTLLGQNVDSYGHDLPNRPTLANLLRELNQIDSLARIRFLTSHPKDMTYDLIDAVASLDKVCEHINLPTQTGDNNILKAMRRGYTIERYMDLINHMLATIPGVALSTDVIVGFPGETGEQFQRTFDILEQVRFDTVHVAAYSPRPGTIASRKLEDDVPVEEKQRRLQAIDELQEKVSSEKNSQLLGDVVEVLVEGRKGEKWRGRTRTDKPVFFESDEDCFGELVEVKIEHAGPWSLQGRPVSTSLATNRS